jgi:hypothetical protein
VQNRQSAPLPGNELPFAKNKIPRRFPSDAMMIQCFSTLMLRSSIIACQGENFLYSIVQKRGGEPEN